MHYRIKLAEENLQKARDRLVDISNIIQANCKHVHVAFIPYRTGQWLAGSAPRRICMGCGLEEEGTIYCSLSSWTKYNYTEPDLGNLDGRYIIEKPSHEFYEYRI